MTIPMTSTAASPLKQAVHNSSTPSRTELVLLAGGLAAMYVPTYIGLNEEIWSVVGQGHGPVMLALTCWLAWQRWPRFAALPASKGFSTQALAAVLFLLGLFAYVVGRSQSHYGLNSGSQLLVFTALVLFYRGWAGLKVMWFPLAFMVTLVPLPGSVVDAVTGPLKSGVSYVAEALLYELGYPIGRTGVMLTIGPYQLLVADACAGLNSILALEAIGIFYMSAVGHVNRWRNVLLASLILPISFVSNVVRVVTLVLVTYYFGDEIGQGFVHEFAGIMLFMVATALTIGVDSLLGMFFKEKAQPGTAVK